MFTSGLGMSNFFDDLGLEMDTCVLRLDDMPLQWSQTLMLGIHDNGNGVHLYNLAEGAHNHLVCAVYRMNGVIESHEIGDTISIKPFEKISSIKKDPSHDFVLNFLKINNIEFSIVETVPLPVDPTSPYDGPRLEDLTLPSPF